MPEFTMRLADTLRTRRAYPFKRDGHFTCRTQFWVLSDARSADWRLLLTHRADGRPADACLARGSPRSTCRCSKHGLGPGATGQRLDTWPQEFSHTTSLSVSLHRAAAGHSGSARQTLHPSRQLSSVAAVDDHPRARFVGLHPIAVELDLR